MAYAGKCHLHIPYKNALDRTDLDRTVRSEMAQNLKRIEDWALNFGKNCVPPIEMPFTFAGPLSAGSIDDLSPPFVVPPGGFHLTRVQGLLGTSGSSTTEVELYRNGSVFTSISLASGETHETLTLDETFVPDSDFIQVAFASIGTGAEDINIQMRFSH